MIPVTVIIASYNHESFIRKSIKSVADQTYKEVQIIVIDDCSTDNSLAVIKESQKEFEFLFLQNTTNIGLNNSISLALEHATGEYIALLASDDYIHSEKLNLQIRYLTEHSFDAVYSNGYGVRGEEEFILNIERFEKAFAKNKAHEYVCKYDVGAPLLQSGLFKKKVFTESLAVRKEFKSDDWAFAIKVFSEYKTGFLNTPLFYYRLHPHNTHKKYWVTFPMRVDVISRMVPEKYRSKALANLFLSQSTYLIQDRKYFSALKFFAASQWFQFSLGNYILIIKSIVYKLVKRNHKI